MGKFKIEMTKDEMIRYYANKIVEDGIKDCFEFSNTINIKDYLNIINYKKEVLERLYRDERVVDVYLDKDGEFDIVFYTDYCPRYYNDSRFIEENEYNYNEKVKKNLLEDFRDYYAIRHLIESPYISIRNLLNEFADEKSVIEENRDAIKNIIKKILIESGFVEKNIDGIEVYITPKNYKEFEKVIEDSIQNMQQEELE